MSNFSPSLHSVAALTVLLVAVLGTGCASRTAYVRPADPTQTQYESSAGAKTPVAATSGSSTPQVSFGDGPPDAWWTLLGSDQINRLVSLALTNNQSLASAQAHLAAAREQIRSARAAFYPQVDATVAAQRTRYGAPVLGSLAKDFPAYSAYTVGPTVSYDLDLAACEAWKVSPETLTSDLQSSSASLEH